MYLEFRTWLGFCLIDFLLCLVVLRKGHSCRERVTEEQAALWLLGWSDFFFFFLCLTWKKAGWIGESEGGDKLEWVTRQPAISKHRWMSERPEVVGGRRRKCGRPCEVEALQVHQQPLSPHWKNIHKLLGSLLSSLHSFWCVLTLDTTSLTKEAPLSRRLKV